MRQVSKKQAKKNSILSKIKKELMDERPYCPISGVKGYQLCHILNRSTFPQYYTEKWNLFLSDNVTHHRFDTDKEFRKSAMVVFDAVIGNVREEDIGRVKDYFGMI